MNNTSSTSSIFPPSHGDVFGSLIFTTAILGIIGNTIVLLLFITKLIKATHVSVLLINLTVADLVWDIGEVMILFADVSDYHTESKWAQSLLCILVNGKMSLPVMVGCMVNLLTVSVISTMRSASVQNAKAFRRSHIHKRSIAIFIVLSWLISIGVVLPWAFTLYINLTSGRCSMLSGYDRGLFIYNCIGNVIFWVVPLIILLVNFFLTVKTLWKSTFTQGSHPVIDRNSIARLLFALTFMYIIIFTPNAVFNIYQLTDSAAEEPHFMLPFHLVSLTCTVADPLLYSFCLPGIKKKFVKRVTRKAAVYRRKSSVSSERGQGDLSEVGEVVIISR